MTQYKWSKTAATNATADSTINWAEGQAPSSVNDSARAEMAATAKARDDHAGSLTTGGTSTAYTLTSNQVFDSLANMSGQKLKVRFNATNGAAPTLNVDSLGAKAIQTASGTAVATGAILANSVHDVTYDNSIPAFLLSGAFAGVYPTLTVSGAADFGAAPVPTSDDGAALGSTSKKWSDLFLASGSVINFNSGDVAITHGANSLSLSGASSGYLFDATISGTAATFSSTLGVSGAATFAALSATTGSFSSTLAATGAATLNNSAGVTARNTIKAFGKVISGVLQSGSFNVTSVTNNAASDDITLASAMANTNYVVLITPDQAAVTENRTWLVSVTSTTVFNVYANGGAGAVDPDSYHFMVLSNE